MRNNSKAESLVGIVIGIFILTIVVLGIGTLIGQSRDLIKNNDNDLIVNNIEKNSDIILKNIDISGYNDEDKLYIYKNLGNKSYELKNNNIYKYIDKYGLKINNINKYNGEIFEREFLIKKVNILGENKNIYISKIKKYIK